MPTKDELEKENADLKKELAAAKELLNDTEKVQEELEIAKGRLETHKDTSWYQLENEKLSRELEIAKADLASIDERKRLQKIEEQVKLHDVIVEEAKTAGVFKQTEHTRFRVFEKPETRDIFGDVSQPVFDLGVEVVGHYGKIQVPVNSVIEMAQSIHMLTEEQAEALKQERDFAIAKANVAPNLAGELTDGIATLVSAFYAGLDSADTIAADDSDAVNETAPVADSNTGDSVSAFGSVAKSDDPKSLESDRQADSDNSVENSDGVLDNSGNESDPIGEFDLDDDEFLRS